jgi:hypothetical protein
VRGVPIPENQSVIANTMMGEGNEAVMKKFLIILRKKPKRFVTEYEICLNMQRGTWMKFCDLTDEIDKIKARQAEIEEMPAEDRPSLTRTQQDLLADYETFLSMLELLAEVCLGKNTECEEIVEKHFEMKLLMGFIEQDKLPFEVRMRSLRLFGTLYLDRLDFLSKVIVPSETMIWNNLPKIELYGESLLEAIENQQFEWKI